MGPDCNKLAGKKCWNPVDGAATTAECGNNDYQCKVNITLFEFNKNDL